MADVILSVVLIVVVGACAEVVRATCRRQLLRPLGVHPDASVAGATAPAEQTSATG